VSIGVAAALSAALACGFGTEPALAHHAFGFYDMSKSIDVTGTVQKYEWSNPHSWLFVEVPSASGSTVYGFEMVSVGELLRRGWAKNSVKPGDKITVTFHPIRDGSSNGILVSATTESGELIGKPPNPR
jgi:hypothetical protein